MASRVFGPAAMLVCGAIACNAEAAESARAMSHAECSDIAHRIACHSINGACRKEERPEVFEDRYDLESMITRLCMKGPSGFGEDHWIDVNGAYHPYRVGADGKLFKRYPPSK